MEGRGGENNLILTESTKAKILTALSYFIPSADIPKEGSIGQLQKAHGDEIYSLVDVEPPNEYTHQITINYLKHALRANKE